MRDLSKESLVHRIEKKIEIPMVILALMIIPVLLIEFEIVSTNSLIVSLAAKIDDGIWFAFLLEYLVLVSLSKDKINYTKRNWINLVIILLSPPLIFPKGFALIRSLRVLRLFRIFRSLRFLIAFKRGIKPVSEILVRHSFHYITLGTFLVIILAGLGFTLVENQEISSSGILQGIWWAIVTVTTVGYGDVYPMTPLGKVLAIVIMIVGISFVSILTANIASYFVEKSRKAKNQKKAKENETQLILKKIEELSKKIEEINQRFPPNNS